VFDHDEEVAQAEEGEMIPYAHRDIKPGSVVHHAFPLVYLLVIDATLRLTPQKHHDRRRRVAGVDGLWVDHQGENRDPNAATGLARAGERAPSRTGTGDRCSRTQDIASEHSTMPYRAPELFDVKTGKTLDEKVDIWVSLPCPFHWQRYVWCCWVRSRVELAELTAQSLGATLFAVAYGHSPFETDGSSIAMAVGSGRYRYPDNSSYSEKVRKLIDFTLVVDPEKRPDIEQVRDARRSL
jgi:serine/threonine kinase 16